MHYYVDDIQAVEPEALPDVEGVTVTVADDLDSMGFNRVTIAAETPEAIVDYVRQNWGTDDEDWLEEWVTNRIERVDDYAEGEFETELMVCLDGGEIASVPLRDGDDRFNAEAERGALDRAYEAKESNPDSVVSIVVCRIPVAGETPLERAYRLGEGLGGLDAAGVKRLVEMSGSAANTAEPDDDEVVIRLSRRDAVAVAEAVALLAGIDEGEHTDYDDLVRLSQAVQDQVASVDEVEGGRSA
jgi:hypothetical protein